MIRLHETINLASHPVAIAFCQDKDGSDVAVALLKTTHTLDGRGRLSVAPPESSVPIFLADISHGEPGRSSLRYASDVVPRRSGTDVALVGHAYSRGRAEVCATLRVGTMEKSIAACGQRWWLGAGQQMTRARPVDKIPLQYEYAYGGVIRDRAGHESRYLPNPVGRGFCDGLVDGAPAPNLEYPARRIATVADRPPPAALGFVPTSWRPRAQWAGTFDSAWHENRRPLLPEDLDERFYNAVPQAQVLRPKLVGRELVSIHHMHPESDIVSFEIPVLRFAARFHVKDRLEELPMEADTLLIEPDQGRFAITFRSSYVLREDCRYLRSVQSRAIPA